MSAGDLYVSDTTALIDFFGHFPVEFRRLKKTASNGMLKIPEGVFRELKRKTDRLYNIIEKWNSKFSIVVQMTRDPQLLPELARIEQLYGAKITVGNAEYPGFWKSPAGRKAADGQVVTLGKVNQYVVVSDDRAVRLACLQENVQCYWMG
jgi:hypothetical protein